MAENSEKRWLPADTILGAEASAETDIALAPLAILARRIRRTTAWGVAAMLTAASVLAIAAVAGAGGGLTAVGSILCISVALTITTQWLGLTAGEAKWWRLYASAPVEAELPIEAQNLLNDLMSGRRSVRLRRGQAGKPEVLTWRLLRGVFAPLVLSSRPDVQALMLRDWYGGDGLTIEFELVASENSRDGNERQVSSPPPSNLTAEDRKFNRFLYLNVEDFDLLLRNAYPEYFECQDGGSVPHRIKLIVRSLQLARDLLQKYEFERISDFRDAVLRELERENDPAVEHHGLRETSDAVSSSWLEKALHPSGYPSIQNALIPAEQRISINGKCSQRK